MAKRKKEPVSPSPHAASDTDGNAGKLSLKCEVGLIGAISLNAGLIIGSGIFMSPEWILRYIGSPGASLLIWVICGMISMLGALSYAELGTVIKESGGEYIYILRNFGPVPAFLFCWTFVFVIKPSGIAAAGLSIAQYSTAPFYGDCAAPPVAVKSIAATTILVAVAINCLNVKLATQIQIVFTACKLLSLLIIVMGGLVLLAGGHTTNFQNAFQGTKAEFGAVALALYQGFWSYDGWNNLNYITEEIKQPEVNLPRALLICLPMVTVLYLLVNVSYLAVMTPSEMITSEAVAVTWGNKVLGNWVWVISLSVVLTAFGSMNSSLFTGSRAAYVAARNNHMLDILSMAHVQRLTPLPSLIFTAIISLIMLIAGDFASIVNYVSFAMWLFYGLTFSALVYMKIKKPNLHRPYSVPILIPIVMLLVSVGLVVAPLIDNPQIEHLYVFAFILSGLLIYVPFIHFKLGAGLASNFTVFLQLLLAVAPTYTNLD